MHGRRQIDCTSDEGSHVSSLSQKSIILAPSCLFGTSCADEHARTDISPASRSIASLVAFIVGELFMMNFRAKTGDLRKAIPDEENFA